jgi:dTDP-glucose 4,6-dehydratase
MRLLVTGGAGFIGSNFVRLLVRLYPDAEIVVLDKLTYAGRLENLADIRDRIIFVHGDICRYEDLEKSGPCDAIFNFAAETHVDRSISDPDIFVKTDVLGTCTLLNYALKHECERYIQVSTDEVYGSIEHGSFREGDPLDPSSPYSASKAAAEHLARSYYKTYHLPVLITRSSNNFGPYQYPEKLIPVLILRALANQPLPIYGIGMNVRDWLYVDDNCTGIDAVYSHGKAGETYNIGAGNEQTNIEIAKTVLRILNRKEGLITFVGDRPGHDFRYAISTEKIRVLGWRPSFSFEDALEKTVAWYSGNTWWWTPLLKKTAKKK